MLRRFIFAVLGLVLALSFSSFAGDISSAPTGIKKEFRLDVRESERLGTVAKNLSNEIDLWHDANLKRNVKRIKSQEKRIFDIIEADIQARDRVIYRYENEVVKSTAKMSGESVNAKSAPMNDKLELRDDVKDLQQARQFVKAKELLFDSIKRNETFSNRYRLLGDYLDIVKRESRLNTVELAEDANHGKKSSLE